MDTRSVMARFIELYFRNAFNGLDSHETPNVSLLAEASAAPVREINILMTSARSKGGGGGGGLPEQPQT